MRVMHLIHIGRLYQIRCMLLVNAEKVLKKIHTAIRMQIVPRGIRIEAATEAVPRIMRIDAIRFGVMGIDYFQIVVATSVFGSHTKKKLYSVTTRGRHRWKYACMNRNMSEKQHLLWLTFND